MTRDHDEGHVRRNTLGLSQQIQAGHARHLDVAQDGADAVLLDEPASNLDEVGIQWMKAQMTAVQALSTVVVATNDEKKEGLKGASLLRIG